MNRPDRPEGANDAEDFLARWSRRKQALREPTPEPDLTLPEDTEDQPPALTDADMPPIETLDEESDYSGFMSPKVSEALRKLALRKMFHTAGFNVRDGLDDYDEDFTSFAKLGDLITSDMRFQMEQEARERAEQIEAGDLEQAQDEQLADGEPAPDGSAGLAQQDERPLPPAGENQAAGVKRMGNDETQT